MPQGGHPFELSRLGLLRFPEPHGLEPVVFGAEAAQVSVFSLPAVGPGDGVIDLRSRGADTASRKPACSISGLQPASQASRDLPPSADCQDLAGGTVLHEGRPVQCLACQSAGSPGTDRPVAIKLRRRLIRAEQSRGIDENHDLCAYARHVFCWGAQRSELRDRTGLPLGSNTRR